VAAPATDSLVSDAELLALEKTDQVIRVELLGFRLEVFTLAGLGTEPQRREVGSAGAAAPVLDKTLVARAVRDAQHG
jgi:hypothetical protein